MFVIKRFQPGYYQDQGQTVGIIRFSAFKILVKKSWSCDNNKTLLVINSWLHSFINLKDISVFFQDKNIKFNIDSYSINKRLHSGDKAIFQFKTSTVTNRINPLADLNVGPGGVSLRTAIFGGWHLEELV